MDKLHLDRTKLETMLTQRFFYVPSFEIYGGVKGFYDFGPQGAALFDKLIEMWKSFFLQEDIDLIQCVTITPEDVFKASGHVEKFSDLMVSDLITHDLYRADHLLKEFCEKNINNSEVYTKILSEIDNYTPEELGEKMKDVNMTSPSGNKISNPFPFNLMFSTSIGPTGKVKGYFRPETAQGMFVNFKRLAASHGEKLPFGVAQIGTAYRNEISPRSGLLRVREFTMAEIEYFVDPENKISENFDEVSNLKCLFVPRGSENAIELTFQEAADRKIVQSQLLAYFLGRTYQFLIMIGIKNNMIRFRQHQSNEMAHYACDCWDAELLTSYGWIECVGHADRSAYDLSVHAQKTGIKLGVYKHYDSPREVSKTIVSPNKGLIGKIFKNDAKSIFDQIETLDNIKLDTEGNLILKELNLSKEYFSIETKNVKEHGTTMVPHVIEPSYGLGRIFYALLEQSFVIRPDDEQRTYLMLNPQIAPLKCVVTSVINKPEYEVIVKEITSKLRHKKINAKIDLSSVSIGKKYARSDEVGVPFIITVDELSINDNMFTLRERNSCLQIRLSLPNLIHKLRHIISGKDVF
jgi:glycyl-tRNA synthetase